MNTQTRPFEIGQKFYYTGDMANSPDYGEIIEVQPATKYTQLRYKCKMQSGKEKIVEHVSFNKSVGQRFKTIEQCNEEKQKAMQSFYDRFPQFAK